MNYLQLNEKGKLAREEQLLADHFGEGNYTTFYKKNMLRGKIKLTADDFVAGELQTIYCAMKRLGISYWHDDYPAPLSKYMHRTMMRSTLGDIWNRLDSLAGPIFVKPSEDVKKFTGFVLRNMDDWILTNGAGHSTRVLYSATVNFVSEYRVPVIRGKNHGAYYYSGDATVLPDMDVVDEMIGQWLYSPKAYCLDVGILDSGETALVEVNDAFSCGAYTMPANIYADLLTTRWTELTDSLTYAEKLKLRMNAR